MRDGAHGPELYAQVGGEQLPRVDWVTVILGPHKGFEGDAVWTWHPGPPLGTLKAGRSAMTAVKLER